jgi:pSer/pThr/pTyr-binding forkhead associated (FHA) protein
LIKSSQVSRKHCELFEKKGLLLVKDLGSSNGTFVNGKKVKDQLVLEPGAELMIGQVKFRVEKVDDGVKGADAPAVVAEVVAVGADDAFEIEIDESDVAPVEAGTSEPTLAAPPAPNGEKKPAAEDEAIEISEDAVADFLFNIEVDEEDKL